MGNQYARWNRYSAFWVDCRKKYGPVFCAVAPVRANGLPLLNKRPHPAEVEHLFSSVFKQGWRTYAFATEEQRDAFVKEFDEAQACGDPVP